MSSSYSDRSTSVLTRRSLLRLAGGVGTAGVAGGLLSACSNSSVTAAGSGAAGSSKSSGPKQYSGQIPVVDDKILYTLAAYDLALANHYFDRYKLQLSTVTSSSGAEIVREALTNLHFGIPASTDAMAAYAADQSSLRIIAGIYDSASLEYIVKTGSPVRTVADLKGKKIGCSTPTALSTYFANLAITRAGLIPGKDVTIAYIGAPPAVYAALQHGLVDCGWSVPPLSTEEIDKGQARLLFSASQYAPHWFDNCIVADAQFVQANPDITRQFLAALGEATQFIRANPSEAGTQWAEIAGQPVAPTVKTFVANRDNFSLSFSASFIQAAAQADDTSGVTHAISNPAGVADGSFLPAPFTYTA